jgi:hypothetical protein
MTSKDDETKVTEKINLDINTGIIVWEDKDGFVSCKMLGNTDTIKGVGLLEWAKTVLLKRIGSFNETSKV